MVNVWSLVTKETLFGKGLRISQTIHRHSRTPCRPGAFVPDWQGVLSQNLSAGADNLRVMITEILDGALLRLIIHVDETEARAVALGPLKVVQDAPMLIN